MLYFAESGKIYLTLIASDILQNGILQIEGSPRFSLALEKFTSVCYQLMTFSVVTISTYTGRTLEQVARYNLMLCWLPDIENITEYVENISLFC